MLYVFEISSMYVTVFTCFWGCCLKNVAPAAKQANVSLGVPFVDFVNRSPACTSDVGGVCVSVCDFVLPPPPELCVLFYFGVCFIIVRCC